jgi:hypothetical protein
MAESSLMLPIAGVFLVACVSGIMRQVIAPVVEEPPAVEVPVQVQFLNMSAPLPPSPILSPPPPSPPLSSPPKNKSNLPAVIGATIGGLLVVTVITLVLVRHYIVTELRKKFSDRHPYPFITTSGMCFLCFELKSNNMFLQTIPHHRISTT